MKRAIIWDEVSSINGISAEDVFANRADLVTARGDIFIVVDDYNNVNEIQIGSVIASNYGMESGLSLQEIADKYLLIIQQELEDAELERLSIEELQEEVATLSYDVMVCQAASNGGIAMASINELEDRSPKFKKIKMWYNRGFWSKEMVGMAVHLGQLSESERIEIVGE